MIGLSYISLTIARLPSAPRAPGLLLCLAPWDCVSHAKHLDLDNGWLCQNTYQPSWGVALPYIPHQTACLLVVACQIVCQVCCIVLWLACAMEAMQE